MATSFSPAPTSNISELNGLGATSSITLPKKKYWKHFAVSGAVLLALGVFGIICANFDSLLGVVQQQMVATQAGEEAADSVPLAPNPLDPRVEGLDSASDVPTPFVAAPEESATVTAPVVPRIKVPALDSILKKKAAVNADGKGKAKKVVMKPRLKRVEKPIANAQPEKTSLKGKTKPNQKVVPQLKAAR